MTIAEAEMDADYSTELRPETQGGITFYHCGTTPGYWFSAGELETMIDERVFLELPDRSQSGGLEEEFEQGPKMCPSCGLGSHLFEMRSYVTSDVRLKACHVCHGRWIGHQSLELLTDHLRYSGMIGVFKRLFGAFQSNPHSR
jgi:Zn-finger nucleic acid-binding protein